MSLPQGGRQQGAAPIVYVSLTLKKEKKGTHAGLPQTPLLPCLFTYLRP